jgi:hypothetical protein
MAKTRIEREREAHEAKLAHVREQIASGALVIRSMSDAERTLWSEQQAATEILSTPVERARRATALENRRRRQARFAS